MKFDYSSLSRKLSNQSNKQINRNKPFSGPHPTVAVYHIANLFRQLGKTFISHLGIVIIVTFVLLGNFTRVDAQVDSEMPTSGDLAGFAPDAVADIINAVSPYTPNIEEQHDSVLVAMSMQADKEYLNAPSIFDTQLATEQTLPPSNQSAPRDHTLFYVVQNGDTLSTVGVKFNLKLATLKYTNDLKDVDTIKPGQKLRIPPNDMSSVAIARAAQADGSSGTSDGTRNTVSRSGSYPNSDDFGVPISHNGISRGLSWYHTGIDYRASVGTAVRASATGRVIQADSFGWNGGWGKTVLIDHGRGRTTRYAHLSRLYVSSGEWVSRGEVIGASGNTGRSTGPHLHFELRIYGRAVYPF